MGRWGRSDEDIRLDIASAVGEKRDILTVLRDRHEREWNCV